jgi:UDP-N-acetylmuramate--alanine ligase
VFQPHRYTRTRALFDEFTRAFYQSDELLVLPVYAASEDPIEGVNAEKLCKGIKAHGHRSVRCMTGLKQTVNRLKKTLQPGDLLLTLGAGDVWKVGEDILKKL